MSRRFRSNPLLLFNPGPAGCRTGRLGPALLLWAGPEGGSLRKLDPRLFDGPGGGERGPIVTKSRGKLRFDKLEYEKAECERIGTRSERE
jgi:hypothetical protein